MAPMVWMGDCPMPRTDAAYPYVRRRQRNRHSGGIGGKCRTHQMRQMSVAHERSDWPHDTPPSSPVSDSAISMEANFPSHLDSSLCARISTERDDRWIILKRRQGLFNIVARTIALVRRNYILEKKVEALRLETRTFLNSVLNNPENREKNERRQELSMLQDEKINESTTSTMDKEASWSSSIIANRVNETRRKTVIERGNKSFVTSSCSSSSSENETRTSNTLIR